MKTSSGKQRIENNVFMVKKAFFRGEMKYLFLYLCLKNVTKENNKINDSYFRVVK